MFTAALALTVLAAEPVSIAVTPFTVVQLSPELGGYAEDRLANQLGQRGFKVTTAADLAALLGMERQRQLLGGGCQDDGECMTEIGAVLGVPLLVVGRLSKIEDRFDVDLRVVRQRNGEIIARVSRGISGLTRLAELMDSAAASLADQLSPKTPFRWRLVVPLATGAALVAVSGVFLGLAESEYFSYTTPGYKVPRALTSERAIAQTFARLSLQRTLSFLGLGLGAALVVTGIVWNLVVPSLPVSVVLAPSTNGGGVVVGGRF